MDGVCPKLHIGSGLNMKEEWKSLDFIGYPNYKVSNMGAVASCSYGLMSDKRISKHGYRRVRLYKDGKEKEFLVHRLVAFAFVVNPHPKEFNIVNHIDENKLNNRADNLEWCTIAYNVTYGTAIRKRVETCTNNGSWNYSGLKELNRKPVYKYDLHGNLIRRFNGMNICHNEDGVNSKILLSNIPIKNGYVYSYKELTDGDIHKFIKLKNDKEESMKIKVYRYDFNGNIVELIEDVRGVDYSTRRRILDCCNNNKLSYNGYIWSYTEKTYDEIYSVVCRIKEYKKIYRYYLDSFRCKEYKDIDCIEDGLNKQYVKDCCNGVNNTYNGSIWSYNVLLEDELYSIKKHVEVGSRVKVYQYNLLGEFVKEWVSIEDCVRAGFTKTKLHDCFKGIECQHKGYIWSKNILSNDEIKAFIDIVVKKSRVKPVYQYTFEGEMINEFNTVKDAVDILGITSGAIHECCKGTRKSYKGYLWSYVMV